MAKNGIEDKLTELRGKISDRQETKAKSIAQDYGQWVYESDNSLGYTINGVTLFETDVPENLREEFRNKDKNFPEHLKMFYTDLNSKHLFPTINQEAEDFFASQVDRFRKDPSLMARMFPDPFKGNTSYNIFHLCKKYNIHPHGVYGKAICHKELDEKNPYPNYELLKQVITAFNDKNTIFDMHSAKHLFDEGKGLLDREETLPFATQVFERSAQAYLNEDELDHLGNFPPILLSYLKYKAIMADKGISVEDSEIMKNPKIQEEMIEAVKDSSKYAFETFWRNMKNDPNTPGYFVDGHFVDVDGTLIQDGKLNKKLYEAMLQARAAGKSVYIFSGGQKEVQLARLKALGVDVLNIPFVNKKDLKNCIICGTIVDDTPPVIQGFCTSREEHTLLPNQDSYEFNESKRGITITIPELILKRKNSHNVDIQNSSDGRL